MNIKNIKLVLSDIDGVLTDGGMYYTESGDEFKKFNVYDGMGFKLLQKDGLKVGLLTSEDRKLNRHRAEKLELDFHFHGIKDKLSKLKELLSELKLQPENVAYVGDDINDLEVLAYVGLAYCPCTAQPEVLNLKNIQILKSRGGDGVIREIHNLFKAGR